MITRETWGMERLAEMEEILKGSSDLPYFYHSSLTQESLWETFRPGFASSVERGRIDISAFMKDGELIGLICVEKMDWDCNHFGFKIGRIYPFLILFDIEDFTLLYRILPSVVDLLNAHLGAQGYGYVSVAIEGERTKLSVALQALGFVQTDTWVTWGFDFDRIPIPGRKSGVLIREYDPTNESEYQEIMQMSWQSFLGNRDRFHNDPVFAQEKADSLYQQWTHNSLKVYDRKALVADLGGTLGGYITAKVHTAANSTLSRPVGELELAAVDEKARGKGLYTDLFIAGLEWLRDEAKVKLVHEKTQIANYQVQNSWKTIGLRLLRTSFVLRKVFPTNLPAENFLAGLEM